MHRTSLRRALPAALALTAALALSSCAADSSATTDDASDTALLPAAEGATEYPLTLDSWGGEITLDERPRRIAALGYGANLDALLALDVTPVYAFAETLGAGWFDEEWAEGIELRDENSSPTNIEAIASVEPDLIVAYGALADDQELEKLSAIAPVLEIADREDLLIDWQDVQRTVGAALDLPSAAESAIADVEEALAAAAETHPEFEGKTLTIAQDYGDGDLVYWTPSGGDTEQLLTRLGFVPNPLAEQFVDDALISGELVSQLDGDALLVMYFSDADRQAREADGLFQAIPAVADGRYTSIVVEGDASTPEASAQWGLHAGQSAVSIPHILPTVTSWLEEAVAR